MSSRLETSLYFNGIYRPIMNREDTQVIQYLRDIAEQAPADITREQCEFVLSYISGVDHIKLLAVLEAADNVI